MPRGPGDPVLAWVVTLVDAWATASHKLAHGKVSGWLWASAMDCGWGSSDRDMGNLKRQEAAERGGIACFVVFLFNQTAQNLRAHVQVPECLGFNLSSPNF